MEAQIVLTGSQVYGPATPESDIDVVMRRVDADNLQSWLAEKNIETNQDDREINEDYSGFYFMLCELKFNIIIASTNRELEKWRKATNKMKRLSPCLEKEARLRIFQNGFNEG